eukprot:12286953-Prorocentrum_lima.AAC.1
MGNEKRISGKRVQLLYGSRTSDAPRMMISLKNAPNAMDTITKTCKEVKPEAAAAAAAEAEAATEAEAEKERGKGKGRQGRKRKRKRGDMKPPADDAVEVLEQPWRERRFEMMN